MFKIFSGRKRMSEAVVVGEVVVVVGTMRSHATAQTPISGTCQRQKGSHLDLELQQLRQLSEILLSSLEGEGGVDGWTTYTASTCQASPGLRWPRAHGQTPGLPALPCVPYLEPSTP